MMDRNQRLNGPLQSGKDYDYMCLYDNCPDRLLSETDIFSHNQFHMGFICNIKEYLGTIAKSFGGESSENPFPQIRHLIEGQEIMLSSLEQNFDDKQREILDVFDEMKWELNDILDLAYHKCCSSLRTHYQRKIKDVKKKISTLQTMARVEDCLQAKSLPNHLDETELNDIVELFAIFKTRVNTLAAHLAEKSKVLSEMMQDDTQLSLNIDLKRCETIQASIVSFIKEQFGIVDEVELAPSPYLNQPDTPCQKGNSSQEDAGICALVALKDNLIATAGKDSKIKLWDLSSGECEGELLGHEGTVWDLKAAFDNQYIFSAGADSTIRAWRISDKKQKMILKGHTAAVYAIEVEESSKTLISGDHNGVLYLWDLKEGKTPRQLAGHSKAILSIKKLNENRFITGSEDQEIKVWDLSTGEKLKSLIGHEGRIYDLSVFKGGNRFASCDSEGMILIWDAEKGVITEKFKAHDKGVRSLAVNENGTLIATGGYDRVFRVWDVESLCLLKENANNDAVIRCIRFLDDTAVLYCDNNVKNYKSSKLSRRSKKSTLEGRKLGGTQNNA